MNAIEVRNLRVRFDTPEGPLHAVDGVSFRIEPGRTLALVGESGSGKSVTALSMLGLLPTPPAEIETGEVLFEGRNLLQLPLAELERVRGHRISMVFQDPGSALHPYLTIGLQLTEILEHHERMPRAAARERAAAALSEVGLPDPLACLEAAPHRLSGGMRQRVMIAMALLCRPAVLIADEPTTALDATVAVQVLELLRRMQQTLGTAILLVTHDLGVVARAADDVCVMYAGRIVEEARAHEVLVRPLHPYTKALLRCAPSLNDPHGERLRPIAGSAPDPLETAAGCAFHPRCELRMDRCWYDRPQLMRVDQRDLGARRSACFAVDRLARGEG